MDPSQQPGFGEKLRMVGQTVGAFIRNPSALVAVVKYKLSQRNIDRGTSYD